MTTTQLTQLKNAGFTLEQIIAIGEIFDPAPPPKVPEPEASSDIWKKLYDKMPPQPDPPRRRPKDFDPTDPEFIRQIERIKRQRNDEGLLMMDASPQSKGGKARAAALSPERRSECARKAAEARWSTKGMQNLEGVVPDPAAVQRWIQRHRKHNEAFNLKHGITE